jgi:hypothetical protein
MRHAGQSPGALQGVSQVAEKVGAATAGKGHRSTTFL